MSKSLKRRSVKAKKRKTKKIPKLKKKLTVNRKSTKKNKRKTVKRKTKSKKWIGKGGEDKLLKMYKYSKTSKTSKTYELSLLLINISMNDLIFLITGKHSVSTFAMAEPSGYSVTINEANELIHNYNNKVKGTIDENGIIIMDKTYYIILEQLVKKQRAYLQTVTPIDRISIKLKEITEAQKTQIENLHTD